MKPQCRRRKCRLGDNPGENEFTYTITNDDSSVIQSFSLSLEVPVFDVFSPASWSYVLTPEFTPDHGGDPDWFLEEPGVYWYTDSVGILPGEELTGFGFSALDIYPHEEFGALATIGDDKNIQFPGPWGLHEGPIDVSQGGYLYQAFTSGPVPEPSTIVLWSIGTAVLLSAYRKGRRRHMIA